MTTSDSKRLEQERVQLFDDFFNNKIPKRMPVKLKFDHIVAGEYSNKNLHAMQFDFTQMEEGAKRICDFVYSDTCPISGAGTARLASFYQILGSKCFKISSQGYVQHPNAVGMLEEDYDALIKDPYACILEKVIPRLYTNLDPANNPIMSTMAIHMAEKSKEEDAAKIKEVISKATKGKGYYPGPPRGSGGGTEAPMDFLGDVLRSFTGLCKDIRRNRNKVIDACEALYPLMFKAGLPPNPAPTGGIMTPLHMAPFLREKDFADIWFPTYKRLLEEYAALGVRTTAFLEQDWMRYLDYLYELPANTVLRFEYGDPQKIKDKLGKKFIISGLYPANLLNTGTKQQVIDKAKELLDIMLPGGGYLFAFDKAGVNNVNFENLVALSEFLRDYSVYPNAGESYGVPLNSEGYVCDVEKSSDISSKYEFNWEEFKQQNPYTPEFAKKRFENYFRMMFDFHIFLLT